MEKLSIEDLQRITKKWIAEKGFKWSAYAEYCHLVEEVGELGESLIIKQGEREAGSGELGYADHSDMEEEIGDVLFYTVVMANRFNIDLNDCFKKTIQR
ncbi:MAG: MazG nucleotide pyrophosphohydrolase domain-containing protein [Candidatus Heimdallarchaeaceae archaeon]